MHARFPEGELPKLRSLLETRGEREVMIETASHLDERTVQGLALTPTQGISRGDPVVDTGSPIVTPVGEGLLGRVLDVLGEPIDDRGELDTDDRRSIHGAPVPLAGRTTTREVFSTGIKAIDVLCPLERGGKPTQSFTIARRVPESGRRSSSWS